MEALARMEVFPGAFLRTGSTSSGSPPGLIFYFFACLVGRQALKSSIFIGPESDHWQCLSVTPSLPNSLTDCCLVNLINVTLACEDTNSELVEVVTVANVDDEDRAGNSLLQIWELRFGHKAKLLFRP